MNASDTYKLVEAIGSIKASKRHGCAISVIVDKLKLAPPEQIIDTLDQFMQIDPTLANGLLQSDAVYFEPESHKFFFKFAQQFMSKYEFDVALKQRSPVIIVDPDISFEGLMGYIEERRSEGELLVVKTDVGITRVYLNPFMDIPLVDFPLPDADILAFLLDEITLPQEGDVAMELKKKKMYISHLDSLTKPTEKKQREKAVKVKVAAGPEDDALFSALAKAVAWEQDGKPMLQASAPTPEAATAPSAQPTSAAPAGAPTTKQAQNFSLVFDKTTNPEEWELILKTVYVIGRWFGDDLAIVCLSAFLELRERRESDLFKLLGFLPTTTAQDKEAFAAIGFPDITDLVAKKEKKELKMRLDKYNQRHLLRSRHRETFIQWEIDLLGMLNATTCRIDRVRSKILEAMENLRKDLMFCPHCGTRFAAEQVQQLQRRGNNYLCHAPCNNILQMIDTADLLEKYTHLQRKIPQFAPLLGLLAEFRNRGPEAQKQRNASSSHRSSTSSATTGDRSKAPGAPRTGPGLKKSAHLQSASKIEPPSFMSDLVRTQTSEHQRMQDTEQEPFDIHPISFGDPSMEDYRVFVPVINQADRSEREVGFRSAKLLLDNIADFVHMVKKLGNDYYHYCYNISLRSLFIAFKRGFRPTEILRYLNNLSDGVPSCIMDRVMNTKKYTNYYPASMLLVNCRYFIRSTSLDIIKSIKSLEGVSHYLCPPGDIFKTEDGYYWLEVQKDHRSLIKEKAFEKGIPVIDEYCFATEASTFASEIEAPRDAVRMKKVPVVLRATTKVRDYQSMSCSKLFWDSFHGHSGILILPCGAGKTLIGITAMATLQQPTIIFCQSILAATQWAEQIDIWTNLSKSNISAITSHHKEKNADADVVITTYSMFGNEHNRKKESQEILAKLRRREWGLMILDEVHQAPADTFRIVTAKLMCHLKLGLTATLVREDAKVAMLPSLVGPTLFELDVSTLRKRDHIAPIECHEIRLPFTTFWKHHYTHPKESFWTQAHGSAAVVKELLFTTNPSKMLACATLIRKHLQEKHKIVIFCDDLIGLGCYEKFLRNINPSRPCPVIDGDTPEAERERIVKEFRDAKNGDWLLFSKVGDMSIDLPEARVLIQIAAAQGSRMQEGQRIGRIQRRFTGKTMAYAYSLVSGESTTELGFAFRRRSYLEDHGYTVQIHEMDEAPNYIRSTIDAALEQELVEYMRGKLLERSQARAGNKKMKRNSESEAGAGHRKQAGFKRQHAQITPEPANALAQPRDLSMMKALAKRFKKS